MNAAEILNSLQTRALQDEELRQRLLETRDDPNPVDKLCCLCHELGYEIYPLIIKRKR